MNKSLKTALSTIAGAFLLSTALSGCTQAGDDRNIGNGLNNGINGDRQNQTQGLDRNNLVGGRNGNTGNNNATTLPGNNGANNAGNTAALGDNGNTGMNNGTANGPDQRRSADIERQLANMQGVDDVNVIVVGDTALVGLRTRGGNATTGTQLRDRVERKVREADNTIKNVTVSDTPDTWNRMDRLGTNNAMNNNRTNNVGFNNNANGNGNRTFMDEFNDLINGINPVTR